MSAIGHALSLAGSMTWEILWALILGFFLSFGVGAAAMRLTDGHKLSAPQGGAQATAEQRPTTSLASTTKPGAVRADLYVMSQCPFGVQAETAFKEVVAKFGDELDLHVEFIGNAAPTGELSSLHGPNEVKGDSYQVCAARYAPAKSFDFNPQASLMRKPPPYKRTTSAR